MIRSRQVTTVCNACEAGVVVAMFCMAIFIADGVGQMMCWLLS